MPIGPFIGRQHLTTGGAERGDPAAALGGLTRALATLAVVVLVVAGALWGVFRPIDNWLTDRRFDLLTRPPTGHIVMVEIDPESLRSVGVWPWPRHVYADLIDRLMAMGAAETVLDIDFSSASTTSEDQALEGALERAGGYAMLAGFRQLSPATGHIEYTLPLKRFLAVSDAVMVNVVAEQDGIVRRYPGGAEIAGKPYPSLAAALSGTPLKPSDRFFLDYGIDLSAIDRIPVSDILAGRVDPRRVAGKQVMIGASAQELHDLFTVPRFGPIPGSLLQILGAETLSQHRALRSTGLELPLTLVALLGALFLFLRPRTQLWQQVATGLVALVLVEAAALGLQAAPGVLLRTAPIDLSLFGFMAAAVLQELETKRRLHVAATRDRDATRRVLDQVIADNFDGVLVVDERGIVVAASHMAEQLLGGGAAVVGRSARLFLPDDLAAELTRVAAGSTAEPERPAAPSELTLHLAGARRTLEYAVTRSDVRVADGAVRPVVCLTFRDITERRRNEERLAFLAGHDDLTGALSRRAFVEAVDREFATDTGRDSGLTVAIVDLGRFQAINDMFGHAFGDEVMKQVVARLDRLGLFAVSRVGGGSFAVARRGCLPAPEARRFAESVVEAIVGGYSIDGRRAVVSAHAGVTSSAASGLAGGTLLSHADMALSVAKTVPGNAVEVFVTDMTLRLNERQQLEAALRQALVDGDIAVHYQPQVALSTGDLVGAEALLRWHHPTLGDISPVRFIPIAEETGLILDLGRLALREACRQATTWPEALRIGVNISPVQFELGDMYAEVMAALALSGLSPDRLDVEITEGLFVGQGHPASLALERLRQAGVGVALDDFGTGYSSLGYLGRLPVDKLKIDRSFVCNLPDDAGAKAVAAAMLTLARTLGKTTIGEGIETPAQARLLHSFGCDVGQGYLYGKAMPSDRFRAHAREATAPHVAIAG